MKLLHELVPGCDKITDKEVILDEIINYVQSLQRQVEFLTLRLATVNPELNIDKELLVSKDILRPLAMRQPCDAGYQSGDEKQPLSPTCYASRWHAGHIPNSAALYHHMPQPSVKSLHNR
ncbi:hypothetical protein QQ045_032925 [Rhodiola kirilowii]